MLINNYSVIHKLYVNNIYIQSNLSICMCVQTYFRTQLRTYAGVRLVQQRTFIAIVFTDETPSKKRKLSLQKGENESSRVQPTTSAGLGSASASAASSSAASCSSKEAEPDELSTPVEEQEDTDWLEVLEKTVTDLKGLVEKKG